MPLDPELLKDIVCPACKKELALLSEERLYCAACRRSYPVRDDIPVLLLDEATIEEAAPSGA